MLKKRIVNVTYSQDHCLLKCVNMVEIFDFFDIIVDKFYEATKIQWLHAYMYHDPEKERLEIRYNEEPPLKCTHVIEPQIYVCLTPFWQDDKALEPPLWQCHCYH